MAEAGNAPVSAACNISCGVDGNGNPVFACVFVSHPLCHQRRGKRRNQKNVAVFGHLRRACRFKNAAANRPFVLFRTLQSKNHGGAQNPSLRSFASRRLCRSRKIPQRRFIESFHVRRRGSRQHERKHSARFCRNDSAVRRRDRRAFDARSVVYGDFCRRRTYRRLRFRRIQKSFEKIS